MAVCIRCYLHASLPSSPREVAMAHAEGKLPLGPRASRAFFATFLNNIRHPRTPGQTEPTYELALKLTNLYASGLKRPTYKPSLELIKLQSPFFGHLCCQPPLEFRLIVDTLCSRFYHNVRLEHTYYKYMNGSDSYDSCTARYVANNTILIF